MTELNKDRIFNENPKKKLIRGFEKIKKDFSKLSAIEYKECYENENLSFILDNSRYIFAEPIKGFEFYKNIMESVAIPFGAYENEATKLYNFISEFGKRMSDSQLKKYESLYESVSKKADSVRYSTGMYEFMFSPFMTMEEHASADLYNEVYEYFKNDSNDSSRISELMENSKDINVMDAVNLFTSNPYLSSYLMEYVTSTFSESPKTIEDYNANSFMINLFNRMKKDTYFTEKFNSVPNVNLRLLLKGISSEKESDILENITTEKVSDYDAHFTTAYDAINRIMIDDEYADIMKESYEEEKLQRLLCKKTVVNTDKSFAIMDSYISEGINEPRIFNNSVIEEACVESTTIDHIPNTIGEQIQFLDEMEKSIDSEINSIMESTSNYDTLMEKYFTSDGHPSKVVSNSINHNSFGEEEKDEKKKDTSDHFFSSTRHHDDDNDDDWDDEKWDNELDESVENTSADDIKKPKSKNAFQAVQNKAIDTEIKFKRKMADVQRNSVDVRNAGKAIAKIPEDLANSVKAEIDKWETLDDDKRKEYIIKPGFRKRYFKALKIALLHYGAFNINPILNIVLLICHQLSHSKDIRIRNELTRELQAEIKVTEEKINDANAKGDTKAKYQLMRIKEKLDAELTRVAANSKYI